MIRRVFVNGYKSLRNIDLEFHSLTVVVGPNAAGKSNLFDALKLLSRFLTTGSLMKAFEDHRGDPLEAFDFGESGLSGLLHKEKSEFTIEVDVELSEEVVEKTEAQIRKHRSPDREDKRKPKRVKERFLRYRLSVSINPQTGVLRVEDEYLGALKKGDDGFVKKDNRRPFLEKVKNCLRLRMERQARPTDYEIGLNYPVASLPLYPPHYPHLIAFREEVAGWQFFYFEPRLMREENPVKETDTLTSSGGDLAAFYHTLKRKNPQQFENIKKSIKTIVPTIENIDTELTKEGKVRLIIREHNVDFPVRVVSEGTLRLLGLLAILSPQNPATVVGLEEPENGVHPRRLKLIAELLKNASNKRQIIVNSHSPLLADHLPEDCLLVGCKKSNGRSIFTPLREATGLFRRQTVEEAFEEERSSISQRILRGDLG